MNKDFALHRHYGLGNFMVRTIGILGFLSLLSNGPLLAADVQVVTVTGFARIKKNHTGYAKKQAIENALREAVEMVVGTYVSSDTLVNNYRVVRDKILTRTKGYVKTYKVVKTYVKRGNYYVELSVWVKNGDLEGDLDALHLLMGRKGNPRVTVAFRTSNTTFDQRSNISEIASNILAKKLLNKGFPVVDFKSVAAFTDDHKLMNVGNELGADVIIIGNIETVKDAVTYKGIEVVVNQVLSSVKAVRLDTGQVIANVSGGDKEPGIDTLERLKILLDRLFDDMSSKLIVGISRVWSREVEEGNAISVLVKNLGTFCAFQEFKQFLVLHVPGIRDVQTSDFSVACGMYSVTFDGSAEKLASQLDGEIFQKKKLVITKTTKNSLHATVVEAKQ